MIKKLILLFLLVSVYPSVAQAPEFTYVPPQEVIYWQPPAGFGAVSESWLPPPGYEKTALPWAPPRGWGEPPRKWQETPLWPAR